MLILTTDKGKTYEVSVVAPVFDGSVTIMMIDKRPLSIIAPEFERIEHMEYYSDDQFQKEYNGYSVLVSIIRTDINNMVQIGVKKPNGGD